MTTHELKTWPAYFGSVAEGLKPWEYRKADRPYAVGDTLHLREWDPELYADAVADGCEDEEAADFAYTGRECRRQVTYIAQGGLIPAGYVVMSLGEVVAPHTANSYAVWVQSAPDLWLLKRRVSDGGEVIARVDQIVGGVFAWEVGDTGGYSRSKYAAQRAARKALKEAAK